MPAKVLLVTPKYYGIEKTIKFLIEESGYDVTWIENKVLKFDYHGTHSKLKLLRRVYGCYFNKPTGI